MAYDVFKKTFEKAELSKFWLSWLANDENNLKICRYLKRILHAAFVKRKNEKKFELV